MSFRTLKRLAASLVAVAVLAIVATPAQAAFKIKVTDITNGVTATIEDGSPLDNPLGGVGNVQFTNAGGGFAAFDVTSSATASATMLSSFGLLTDNFAAIRNTSAGNIDVMVEFTIGLDATAFGGATGFDFSANGTPGVFTLSSTLTGNSVVNGIAGLPVMVQASAGTTGADFLKDVNLAAQSGVTVAGPVTVVTFAPATTTPVLFFDADGKASLTTTYRFMISPEASYNFGSQSILSYNAVPEPATYLSALPLLLGGIYWARRRRS